MLSKTCSMYVIHLTVSDWKEGFAVEFLENVLDFLLQQFRFLLNYAFNDQLVRAGKLDWLMND